MNIKEKITALREDKRGVSPVIGVIMMIAIVVIIAAVVAAFAYGIIGGVNKAPSTALVMEGVKPDTNVSVTIFHHGGDTITKAFKLNGSGAGNMSGEWDYIEIRLNGVAIGPTAAGRAHITNFSKNDDTCCPAVGTDCSWEKNFKPGDQLDMEFDELKTEDSIVILHVPSASILQRVMVT